MYCTKKITDDLIWVGADDRRLAMFEGVYAVPHGVSYNSYLLLDEKTVLFDTVDRAAHQRFFENVAAALGSRPLDYLVIQHMEPDHSSALIEIAVRYPGVKIVCNEKTLALIKQFYDFDAGEGAYIVGEGDALNTGRHTLNFIMAPMVHWPEVMVTYDSSTGTLFSADAFGSFGALNGALFSDEVDFNRDYMDEARRYYTNIVGKYGWQVSALLNKASALSLELICPLHGFIWRGNVRDIMSKYLLWSAYEPEEYGVMIAYASVYGNTENAAEILACRLRERGVRTAMYDVSVTPASSILSEAFRWSHLVFASTTYNAGIFVAMESVINDLVAHNIQNRTVAIIENGSWAAMSGELIRLKLLECRNMNIIENIITINSGLKTPQLAEIDALADALAASLPPSAIVKPRGFYAAERAGAPDVVPAANRVDMKTMFKLSYGLFVLTVRDGDRDNGCIINTVAQMTETPLRISITVNKANYTHDVIIKTGAFNVSVLDTGVPFSVFERFGFQSGRDKDKFAGSGWDSRAENGIRYMPKYTNGVIAARVAESYDYGTHTLFVADVTEAFALSDEPSVTYQYYFDNIKPKPKPPQKDVSGFVCRICGYMYEGDELPADYVCPLCKHGPDDFERIG